MATNEIFKPGARLPVPVPATVVAGNPVVVGSLVGVAQIDRDSAGYVSLDTDGVYELTVTGAINFGDPVYAVVAGGLVTSLTATVGSNTRFGTSLTTQAATGKCRVKIRQP
jgi:predicted RecA/RadA family phage recombinase